MIRDGVDAQPVARRLRREGWRDISTVTFADHYSGCLRMGLTVRPTIIEGLTSHGVTVLARYDASGDYEDRWTNISGTIAFNLTHWRPVSD